MSEIPILCPKCRSVLERKANKLVCGKCGKTYGIVNGIPRMVESLDKGISRVRKGYDLQWSEAWKDSEFTHFNPVFRKKVPDYVSWDTMIDKKWFRGKKVLDAGCGSGRWSFAMASLGAEVPDIVGIGASPDGKYLFFITKESRTLWGVRLGR